MSSSDFLGRFQIKNYIITRSLMNFGKAVTSSNYTDQNQDQPIKLAIQ